MPTARSFSEPKILRTLLPMLRLLQWGHESLEVITGQSSRRHWSLDAVDALLLVGAITTVAVVGLPPLLSTVGAGVAILFVLGRSRVAVQEQAPV